MTNARYVDGAFIGNAHEFLADAGRRAQNAEAIQQAVKRAVPSRRSRRIVVDLRAEVVR